MHDVLDPRDLVPDEAEQMVSSGFPAEDLLQQALAAAAQSDLSALVGIREQLAGLVRGEGWKYDEPTEEPGILAALQPEPGRPTSGSSVADRIHGAWLGRCVGCTMGKPVEGLTPVQINRYLDAVPDWPQVGFLPLLDKLPAGVDRLHESAPYATTGHFESVPRDDDIDWTILGLHTLELYGPSLSTTNIAKEWLDRLPFTQTFTAERAAYRNLVRGIAIPQTAVVENPYREWIGALIRGDIFGYTNPGNPAAAARMALVDARLSHVSNGIYGEMWAAALIAAALVSDTASQALETALGYVPRSSRLYESQRNVLHLYRERAPVAAAMAWFEESLGHYNWVHTVNNAALISLGLLWGAGDFVTSVALTIRGGRDTDSDAATVGSVMGALQGRQGVPARLSGVFGNRVRSSVRDFDGTRIDELAARTVQIADAVFERANEG